MRVFGERFAADSARRSPTIRTPRSATSTCSAPASGRWCSVRGTRRIARVPPATLRRPVRRAGGADPDADRGGVRRDVADVRGVRRAGEPAGAAPDRGGCGSGVVGGVAMRRSVDLLVGMYAVVKAGGAYVPVDPDQPAERSRMCWRPRHPVLVLTTLPDSPVACLRCCRRRRRAVDVSGFDGSPGHRCGAAAPLRPANTAYVIFTSGSTGGRRVWRYRTGRS